LEFLGKTVVAQRLVFSIRFHQGTLHLQTNLAPIPSSPLETGSARKETGIHSDFGLSLRISETEIGCPN